MRILIFSTLFLFMNVLLKAQDLDNFQPLQSKGKIPEDFIKKTTDKYIESTSTISKNNSWSEKKTKKEFYLENNFNIDRILRSGFIIFNDTLSGYVNKVGRNLLKEFPQLDSKIRFYILKTSEVNAFATDQGIIFVTVGLLAQLQNEAQLAFILSHEIIHIKNEHSINSYIIKDDLVKGKGNYRGVDKDLRLSSFINYSQENETEADKQGFETFYSKTDYSTEEIKKMFDILLYSYLPIEEIDFNKSFFETEHFKFPDSFTTTELNPISAIEDYDDSKSSHPNIKKRRELMNGIVDLEETGGNKKFIVSTEENFQYIKNIARYELCNIYLIDRQYEDAIYTAYVLMKLSKNKSKYLKEIIAKSLYSLCKYKNKKIYNDIHVKPKKVEGAKQQVNSFFEEISKEELNVLTLLYLWNLHVEFQDDSFMDNITDEVFNELTNINKLTKENFYTQKIEELKVDTLSEEELNKLDKYERIKYKKKIQSLKKSAEVTYSYAFMDLMKDKDFIAKFDKALSNNIEDDDKDNEAELKKEKLEKKYGKKLGIDKIVLVNPFVLYGTGNDDKPIDFIGSETREIDYIYRLQKLCKKVNLETEMLDNKILISSETDRFNDYCKISNWFYELIEHDGVNVTNTSTPYVKSLVDKYNTKYFAWTSMVVAKGGFNSEWGKFISYSATITGIPIGFYYLTKKVSHLNFAFYLYDIEKGELVFKSDVYVVDKDKNDILNSYLYDALSQIKSKPKK
ncbi:MAG: hypothetical protein A2046_10555 [Bacteroidetes bacterium GWA2_30_7]|nr:MAG: hypothetical protein A2046_10555 [Bacteroidetes bacterium GWA2_30_7]